MTSGQHMVQTSRTTYVRDHEDYIQNALDARAPKTALIGILCFATLEARLLGKFVLWRCVSDVVSGGVAWCMVLVSRRVEKAPWHDLFRGRFLWKCCSQSSSVQSRTIQNNADPISALHGALKARRSTCFPHPQVDWTIPSAPRSGSTPSMSCMKASHVAEGRHLGALGHEMRVAESSD